MKNLFIILSLLFIGCGYKPSSYYTKNVFGDRIYVDTIIDVREPENLVVLKDSLNEAVVTKFKGKITPKERADTILHIRLKGITFTPVSFNDTGFAVLYKNVVTLETSFRDKKGKKHTINSEGDYFFYVNRNSVITDQQRFKAIKVASLKALDYFISKASMIGFLTKNEDR